MKTTTPDRRFRETLWFKKGHDDSIAAEVVVEAAIAGKTVDLAVEEGLPVEDRYRDDGSLTGDDSKKYSLRTGGTREVPALPSGPVPRRWRKGLSERQLVGELTPTRRWLTLAMMVLCAGIGVALVHAGVTDPVLALLR